MTVKTVKSRNSDRRSGKAWSKKHEASVKALSPEDQARKAHKDAERKAALTPPLERSRVERGSNFTMPRITWEWCTSTLAACFPNTHRLRMVDACIASEKGHPVGDSSLVIESNPEIKATRSYRKNGR